MNPKLLAIIIVAAVSILIVSAVVYASTTVWVPTDNNRAGTPLTAAPSATPTPTPTPTQVVNIIGGVITANDTDTIGTYIFVKGSILHLTVQTNSTQSDVEVQLFNKGVYVATAFTDASGKADFFRIVNNEYDFNAKIKNELP